MKEWTRLLGQTGSVQTFSSTAATDRFGNTYISGTTVGSIAGQPKVPPGLNKCISMSLGIFILLDHLLDLLTNLLQ
ncbi:SBBP repeat-containing protein [Leptospira sp. WS4.C2]